MPLVCKFLLCADQDEQLSPPLAPASIVLQGVEFPPCCSRVLAVLNDDSNNSGLVLKGRVLMVLVSGSSLVPAP